VGWGRVLGRFARHRAPLEAAHPPYPSKDALKNALRNIPGAPRQRKDPKRGKNSLFLALDRRLPVFVVSLAAQNSVTKHRRGGKFLDRRLSA